MRSQGESRPARRLAKLSANTKWAHWSQTCCRVNWLCLRTGELGGGNPRSGTRHTLAKGRTRRVILADQGRRFISSRFDRSHNIATERSAISMKDFAGKIAVITGGG